MIGVGIVGSSGYVGETLLKLLAKHPKAKVEVATSDSLAGKTVCDEVPGSTDGLVYTKLDVAALNALDVVFLAVPHGEAKKLAPSIRAKTIDMTGDHRLEWTYGIPELNAASISKASKVANPGCYATSCILSAHPLKDELELAVFDCASGYSGGGKSAKYDFNENVIAYKLTDHFHNLEIAKALGPKVCFTPHVVNAFSGIMCTAHLFPKGDIDIEVIKAKYSACYAGSFTSVVEGIPTVKEVANTPFCKIGGFAKGANGRLVVITVLDNLMKGAASQAVENMNIMFQLDRKEGLI